MTPQEILEKLHEKWDELMAKAQALLDAFNHTLDRIGRWFGWIAEKAADFWNDHVVPKWQEAVDWMGEHWNVFGAPWLCFGAAGDWRTLVGQPVSERAGPATKGQLEVDTTWKGSAAQRYNDRLTQQEGAIKGVSEQFAETIASRADQGRRRHHRVVAGDHRRRRGPAHLPPGRHRRGRVGPRPAGRAADRAHRLGRLHRRAARRHRHRYRPVPNAKGDLEGVRSKLSGYPEGAWPSVRVRAC